MQGAICRRLLDALRESATSYCRLVILVGVSGTGKTGALRELAAAESWPVINVNLWLSERLLDLTRSQRPRAVSRCMEELLGSVKAPVVVFDNIEMLFDPALKQNPLLLLQGLAREQAMVVSWNGTWDGKSLTYAAPGHAEWGTYSTVDATVVNIVTARVGSEEGL